MSTRRWWVLNQDMSTRWQHQDAPRGDEYDQRWRRMAAAGKSIHGEADFVDALLRQSGGTRVLDAGCGTGRVAIELAARGYLTVGVDADASMLAAAREKAPGLTWLHADLCRLAVDDEFDIVVLAGNVMIFLDPGTEGRVLQQLARTVTPGGLVVAGFSLRPDRLQLDAYDRHAAAAGLHLVQRWASWDGAPFTGGDYAVSVHRK
jgi:SAM-dependent methyltransferase